MIFDLFSRFVFISLLAFGGGGAALPLVERLAVNEAGWASPQDFAAAVACGYVTPGPVLITATFVGYRAAGLSGAIAATFGVFLMPWFLAAAAAQQLRRFMQHLLLAALLALGCLVQARDAEAAEAIPFDFDTSVVGILPTGFSSAVTGGGGPAFWLVIEEPTAPSSGKVLAQTSTDKTSVRFPLCVYDGFTAPDVTVSVSFKPVSGTVDQAAGLVARYRDKDNYYVVRANALENNVRLYKVERGNRKQLAGANVKVPSGEWQTLALEVKGTHFRVLFNDVLLFEADDATFKNAGKVGLWTKADSVTYFDNLRVKTDATR